MIFSTETKLAGVLGWPIGHSKSPRLHGHWLQRYGIDGAYLPLPARPENFEKTVDSLLDLGFRGANVTIPHKEAAFHLCHEVTDRAKRVKAVNTLVFRDGRIEGDNSDGYGFTENLKAGANGWEAAGKTAVILGAGGAARGLAAALLDVAVGRVILINRTLAKAEAIVEELGAPLEALSWDKLSEGLAQADLLVNSTSLGMTGQAPLEIDLTPLPQAALVTDIVYAPLKTELLLAAERKGHLTVDGLGMLLHQARPGFAAWYGREPEVDQRLRDFVLGEKAEG